MVRVARTVTLWLSLVIVTFLAWRFTQVQNPIPRVSFDEMLACIERGEVHSVAMELRGNGPAAEFRARMTDGQEVRSAGTVSDGVMDRMRAAGVVFDVRGAESATAWTNLLISWAPFILLVGFWLFFMMRSMKGNVNINDAKKAVVSRLDREPVPAGTLVGSAAVALSELRTLVSGPSRPAFVLVAGPSGSGKSRLLHTLVAQSGRPCLLADAASFVEVFVGIGAARVRDLMARARAEKAALVVIDGLDELCRVRAAENRGERDERSQAMQQLATSLDALRAKPAFAFIGVSNRPELLDEAIVRRFDRVLTLTAPDIDARGSLLREMLLAPPGVDVRAAAVRTEGWLPADLEAVVEDARRRSPGSAVSEAELNAALSAREDVRALAMRTSA